MWYHVKCLGHDISVSIELPVATRHHLDMTEKVLKAPLNPNKQHNKGPGVVLFTSPNINVLETKFCPVSVEQVRRVFGDS